MSERNSLKADKEYLKILYLAADESEERVDDILNYLIQVNDEITFKEVESILQKMKSVNLYTPVNVKEPNLNEFDLLLEEKEVAAL